MRLTTWIRFGGALFPLVSATALAAPEASTAPPCDEIKKRPALVIEAEQCLAKANAPADREKLRSWIKTHSFAMPRADVKDEGLVERADRLFGEQATKAADARIAITAPDGTQWAPASKKIASAGSHNLLGGLISLCTTSTTRGHFDLTQAAARTYRHWIKKDASKFLAMSVVNVDDHAWRRPEAHAQNGTGADGLRPLGKDTSVTTFEGWITTHAGKLKAACAEAGQTEKAAYELGVVLHATQDLATHAGITNPEHAALMIGGQNPDGESKRLDLAQRWSLDVLKTLEPYAGKECLVRITDLNDATRVDQLGEAQLGPIDAKSEDYAVYVQSGADYALHNTDGKLHVQWFDPANETLADAFFKAHVLDRLR